MRRRSVVEKNPMPRRLAVYRSEEWPGPHESARMTAWADARRSWGDDLDLDVLPGGHDYVIPDEPWDEALI